MTPELANQLEALLNVGWKIARVDQNTPLPSTVAQRYAWAPPEILEFATGIGKAVSPDDKAWILSAADYAGTSEAAFAWNEWELIGLSAAEDNDSWRGEILHFWDRHLPILMSVKNGYAYFAIERATNMVVVGEEPEFEETMPLVASLSELLKMIAARSSRVERWL